MRQILLLRRAESLTVGLCIVDRLTVSGAVLETPLLSGFTHSTARAQSEIYANFFAVRLRISCYCLICSFCSNTFFALQLHWW